MDPGDKHRDDNRSRAEAMIDRPELRKRSANFVPLSPVSFLARAAQFFGDRVAILHRQRRFTYRDFYVRARRLAHALTKAGVKRGDTVAILAANTPAMLEAHFAAPMIGAVLNPINIRPRRAPDRLLPRARRGQGAAGRSRVPRHDRACTGVAG
jgi:long-subunit acyl-CoA synthetase (AMP-forming)